VLLLLSPHLSACEPLLLLQQHLAKQLQVALLRLLLCAGLQRREPLSLELHPPAFVVEADLFV
jgi:hypothetical protein